MTWFWSGVYLQRDLWDPLVIENTSGVFSPRMVP